MGIFEGVGGPFTRWVGNRRAQWRPRAKTAWVVLVAGTCVAVAAAWGWQSEAQSRQSQSLDVVTTQIGARAATTLRQNLDLVDTARAVVEANPDADNQQFVQFMTAVNASVQYKDSVVVVFIQQVPASQLNSFWTSVGVPVQGTVGGQQVTPAGNRPQYCLLRAGALQVLGLGIFSAGAAIPAGTDYCATSAAEHFLRTSADTGQFVVTTLQSGLSMTQASLHLPPLSSLPVPARQAITTLFNSSLVIAPVYRPGLPTTTTAERASALLGWTLDVIDTRNILQSAVGRAHLAVTLSHQNPGAKPTVIVRTGPSDAKGVVTRTVYGSAAGPWNIAIRGSLPLGGGSPLAQGALIGIAVLIIALLLFALITVLSRSRAKALALVEHKTSQLAHQALHDALTGLPNRALILDRAEQMLSRARREHHHVGALFLDLDNFKAINDWLGHGAGDQLLQELSARLASVLRATDTVGRLGGDEFVILVECDNWQDGPERVAERLLTALRAPYFIPDMAGGPLTVTASIGIALGVRDSAEELLRDADVALYVAKASGKNTCRLFRSEMQYAVADRLELEMELWTALDNGQLFIVYQPIFDLTQGSISGVEALLRWEHPTRGLVGPELFIPIAEDTGLILPIGKWVMSEACRQGAEWHRLGMPLSISVNLSVRQLESDRLVDDVRDVLAASGLDPRYLTLEITESTLMREPEATVRRLRALKSLRVRLAVDDFGTGYSSLAYLRQFPVDVVKIDRSFINGISESSEAAAVIHALIQLGKTLDLETLAEGIEEPSQLAYLRHEGCDAGQGFLFSPPLDAADIEPFIRDSPMDPSSVLEPTSGVHAGARQRP